MMALELAHRAERGDGYHQSFRDSNESLRKLESKSAALEKRVSKLSSELSLVRDQNRRAEEENQKLSLELQKAEHKGLLEGMSGCCDQILVTPVGQQFFHVLKEELIYDFCKTPHFLDAFGDAINSLLDAGRKFALSKLSVEDLTPAEDFKELVMQAPNPSKILGVDENMHWDSPWWMNAYNQAFQIFTRGSFSDPSFPAWGELPFPVSLYPTDVLPFDEIDQKLMTTGPDSSPEHTPIRDQSPLEASPSFLVLDAHAKNVGSEEDQGVSTPATSDQVSSLIC